MSPTRATGWSGHLLGTADMLAQMADRCYLEKCRDRLYAEFVLGDVAVHAGREGVKVLYGSGLDLLRQTPKFIASTIDEPPRQRLSATAIATSSRCTAATTRT